MLIYLRVLKESFFFAMNALRTNLLRTFLSLLGVTIGIFSIIGVLAAIDSLENEITDGLSSLDISTIYVLNRSFGPTELERYEYEKFPNVSYDEYQMLQRSMDDIDAITYTVFASPENIKYEDKTATGVNITPGTESFYDIENLKLKEGRFFNGAESNSGSPVAVIGSEVASSLFGDSDPIGKRVRLYGNKFTIIGVLEKEGQGIMGPSKDGSAFVPVNFVRKIYGDNNKNRTAALILKPKKGVDQDEFIATFEQQLRSYRGLKPDEITNFFINPLKGFADLIDTITGTLKFVGGIIAGFSVLVGGFGIANIMFVSVKERTNLIGIQKSLGAKRRFILSQFLFESIILALFGGLFGLLFVWLGTLLANSMADDFTFVLSAYNILWGTSISMIIGLVAGIIPAFIASRLDPVEAIRTGM
ncbi:putative ABC transport system permease protein [Nonlabens xylanidelens]|uniref:Putative ABC transport system permease protein n=1 Tax=Nonlabens xylanidelens TaxID=191564 RepID=A0A2S6ISE2_9FLAO|nr:ABC transporter permease [Nonlabens xylanidelens]PPK97080.1 putative ABC transport system permease protein [Nonlabens xylanidelens]PQJ13764.1 ABC transporter permease [Nonlabens xylanidelens]